MKTRSSPAAAVLGVLLLAVWLSKQVAAIYSKPPRLNACREIMKAKDASEVYLASSSYSCQNVTFPCAAPAFPDTRNCENYYMCDSMTVRHCPCPAGQSFNIATLTCDSLASACDCAIPPTEPATTSTFPSTTTAIRPTTGISTRGTTAAVATSGRSGRPDTTAATTGGSGPTTVVRSPPGTLEQDNRPPAPVVEMRQPSGDYPTTAQSADVTARSPSQPAADSAEAKSEASIVVSAIVCGSVVTVAVIATVVYLCHRTPWGLRKDAKLPGLPCGEMGYTHAGMERHLYYEIDDRAMSSPPSFDYRPQPPPPPPLPATQPSAYPPPPPCTRCSAAAVDERGRVPSLCSAAAGTTANSKKQFPATNPYLRCEPASTAAAPSRGWSHSHECSSDGSLYSGCSSNQSTLESTDGDMKVPLNAPKTKSTYVSKQVYI